MRTLLCLTVLAAALAGASLQARAEDQRTGARSSGAYAVLDASDDAACMRLCADDGLCMAWRFRQGACELRATVPRAGAGPDAAFGLSSRAPASMRRRSDPPVPPAAAAATPAPDAPPLATAALNHPTLELLGGPEDGGPGLRPRLGSPR